MRNVLVTGASTGIGEASAIALAQRGFQVFAGVRKAADGARLQGLGNGRILPISLDVTSESDVAAAREEVAAAVGEKGLQGLVNNAGVAVGGPMEFVPLDRLRHQLEVNVVGQVAVTQAFLPLIRTGRGRIVNIGSISGRLTAPYLGPYCASKYALEAVTGALRKELSHWGLHVSMIEPGVIKTPIWTKALSDFDEQVNALPVAARELYGKPLALLRNGLEKVSQRGTPAEAVAEAVYHALTAPRPKLRYVIGRDAKLGELVRALLPEGLLEKLG